MTSSCHIQVFSPIESVVCLMLSLLPIIEMNLEIEILLKVIKIAQGSKILPVSITTRPSADMKSKLLRTIGDFQSHLLAITSSLSTSDRIESEICFYRLLQEYTPIFSTLPIPACVWRRAREIVRTNQEFCQLIGYHRSSLETESKCIYRLWNDS
ncbi:uncharacterized protein MELLADRAFT_118663 [Melampsora larici-populina 98AG31]|uniref:ERT1/acuK family PAS domain-containing protein n=1 Tax=Melampsora larici-populina (strain 98AG31 / pathotype 3-4-7) TaxID=747676 RepID=F4SCG5_MELLP|nr:uncharacterized protein MELLADRAFT_118663 [Melampsora larici-populina 98AG31]EGF97662.1 hypothetical protein MELLADRAFT_118663 [Melampsora larici-populina 98AG31]